MKEKDLNKLKLYYGLYNPQDNKSYDPMYFIEPGSQVLWTVVKNLPTKADILNRGWLLGKSEGFDESGHYDIVVPEEGVVSVHYDRLQAITVAGNTN
tara:strand:+ start:45 stop:335 length:291 start_codon:yes stop_codon:yes gene_type:complete